MCSRSLGRSAGHKKKEKTTYDDIRFFVYTPPASLGFTGQRADRLDCHWCSSPGNPAGDRTRPGPSAALHIDCQAGASPPAVALTALCGLTRPAPGWSVLHTNPHQFRQNDLI